MKNIFICHRPYHVLRSADIIFNNYMGCEYNNILMLYNHNSNTTSNKYFDTYIIPGIEVYYNKIIKLQKDDEIWIGNIFRFVLYYKKKVKEYRKLVKDCGAVNNIYFYSDLEKPIGILVSTFRAMNPPTSDVILVDEGIASYYLTSSKLKNAIKYCLVSMFRLKYISSSACYGQSDMYTKSMATFPEKCVFHGDVIKLEALNSDLLLNVAAKNDIPINFNNKYVLYLSNLLFCMGISRQEELKFVVALRCLSNKLGYDFYIKPHPTQEKEYYHSNEIFDEIILSQFLPAELFMSSNCIVMSVSSSSLINAHVMGMNTISLSRLLKVEVNTPFTEIPNPATLLELEDLISN